MTLVEKLSDVRDFEILETTVKEIGENYSADVCQIVLSNPLDGNFTSICEYISNPEEIPEDLSSTTFPVQPEGGGLGWLSVSRQASLSSQEVDEIRITLANIADILRYAQINDIVQRDTFRSAFMSEITNLMSLPMGLGDALFMVVNILGKALAVSRCIFICVDDSAWVNLSEWKSYEYWQRDRIEAAQEYGWPTKDSAVVAQTLLANVPIIAFEGQQNSFKTPVQEEMEFIGVRSQLSVALRSSVGVHGCIILQQCESRHAWTRDEIDMVQNVADTVAEALSQLDEEKKTAEPIMRLHQREVADTKDPEQHNLQEVRKALKSALGKTAIRKAQKSREPEPPPLPPPPAEALEAETTEQSLDFAPQSEDSFAEPADLASPPAGEPVEITEAAPEDGFAAFYEENQPADPSLSQFSPSDIWTEQEGGLPPPPEPNYEEVYSSAELSYTVEPGFESTGEGFRAEGDFTAETSYETEPALEGEAGYEGDPGFEATAGFEAAAGLDGEAGFEGAPGLEDASGFEGEQSPAEEAATPELSGLANMLEQQAAQTGPPPGQFSSILGGLLGNRRGSTSSGGAWDIQTSFEQPPPPVLPKPSQPDSPPPAPARTAVPPPPKVTVPPPPPNAVPPPPPNAVPPPPPNAVPPPPPNAVPPPPPNAVPPPPPNAVPPPPPNAVPPVPKVAVPPVPKLPGTPAQKVAVPPVPKLPGIPAAKTPQIPAAAPQVPPVPRVPPVPPVGKKEAAPPPEAPPPAQPASKAQSKWGNLDAIGTPSAGAQPAGDWAQLNSIPTPTTQAKTGLGAMMMGKAKASAVAGNTGLGQSFHKGGMKPPTPPSYVEGPPLQMNEAEEAAAEARLKQILASSNPTSDFIFATPNVDMRLLGRIDGWVSQIEPKDKYVNGHIRSVAEYSMAIARLIGLSSDDVNTIRLAAIIHDVGKLGLPKVILQKPDEELSDTELVMSMNHTIDGAKLLEEFQELAPLAPIVLGHHEEFDGNGYPEGLAGENIPLAARIIHVCNSYTELVTDLVFRAGIDPGEAQEQLLKASGTTYDPDMVQALLACISQGLVPARIV